MLRSCDLIWSVCLCSLAQSGITTGPAGGASGGAGGAAPNTAAAERAALSLSAAPTTHKSVAPVTSLALNLNPDLASDDENDGSDAEGGEGAAMEDADEWTSH